MSPDRQIFFWDEKEIVRRPQRPAPADLLFACSVVSEEPPVARDHLILIRDRVPLYEQAMHFPVGTDHLIPEDVAGRILVWLRSIGKGM